MVEINRREKKQYGPPSQTRNVTKVESKLRSKSIHNEKLADSVSFKATTKVVNNDRAEISTLEMNRLPS